MHPIARGVYVGAIVFLLILIITGFFIFFFKPILNKICTFLSNYAISFIVVTLVICIIIFPNESVKAAYNGLEIWFKIVFPALFPFFVGSELLKSLGIIEFIGTLLEPLMRPIFNVPGEGSFALAMSVVSGYPVGVKITADLRKDRHISNIEAQRLVSFCSTSGPLFMIGSVSIGMFKSSQIGIILATCHYIAALVMGISFSFYKKSKSNKKNHIKSSSNYNIFKRAFLNLANICKYSPPFGKLLGDSISSAINTILMVGGFIILFSVIVKAIGLIGLINLTSNFLLFIIKPFHPDPLIIKALITGLFEVTIGCKLIADAFTLNLVHRVATASFIIGWSGLSIHAQSISILSTTDIKPALYMVSKFFHGLISCLLVYILYPVFIKFFTPVIPTSNFSEPISGYYFLSIFKLSAEFFILVSLLLLLTSLIIGLTLYLFSFLTGKG